MAGYFRRKKSQPRPRTLQKIILYSIFMSMSTSLVSSNAIASLHLKRYSNPKHKDITGDCCDWCAVGSLRPCENQLTLCIADTESASLPFETFFSSSASDHCPYFYRVIYHHNGDNFDFTPVLRFGIPNPFPINITDFKGGFLIAMKIVDDDDGSKDDIVDYYKKEIYITPSKSVHSARTYPYTLSGPGYSQTTIEVKVYCDVNFYGATCSVKCVAFDTDDDGHYTCDASTGEKVCLPGYNGALCKIEINECESSPCQNGGSCRDHRNYFTCECAEGTSGDRCEINFDECFSDPCQHRSSCVDQINGYQCQCVDGYTGPTCSVDVDECVSSPCKNNATCVDQVNKYTCECQPGYEGSQCDSKGSVLLTTLLIAAVALLLIILLIATFTLFRRHNCLGINNSIPRRGYELIFNIAYINEDD